jgi:hypothetical protein
METALKTRLKAETIAQAVYTATGIKPDVIYRENRNPLITFSKANGLKMKDFLTAQIKKKSDVDIDILPIFQPVIMGSVLPYLIAAAAGIFIAGYLTGQAH